MTIGIDFVGTNLGSGTKTYNISFCNQLNTLSVSSNIKVFICSNYLTQISTKLSSNSKVKYIIKPNFLSITLFRLLWMQFIFPIELKLLKINTLYSPMNFTPFLARLLKIKTVLCLHSNLPWVYFNLMPGNTIRNFLTKKLMELSIYVCDILIVDSFFAKKEITKALSLHKKKIEVVYLSVKKSFFKNNSKSLINNFDYKNDYILSVMSCVRYHNIVNLLQGFKLLIKEVNSNIKLVLVLQILDKGYFLEIKKYIKDNFKKDKIIIFINLESQKLPALYASSKLYVFTSYCEVFGLTSLEAMSQSTPVVISNKSSLPEINGTSALYFDPDNIVEIKKSLKKVLFNTGLRKKLLKSGNTHYKKFNSNQNVNKTIQIINKISQRA
tara:strand:+ start:2480 stop:3628 length:1149 start_codon:yes stop_codon:yes gene_type:complete